MTDVWTKEIKENESAFTKVDWGNVGSNAISVRILNLDTTFDEFKRQLDGIVEQYFCSKVT